MHHLSTIFTGMMMALFISPPIMVYSALKKIKYKHWMFPEWRFQKKINPVFEILLVLAITLHNIPEGLAVGVAFGAVALDIPEATFGAAVALAIGIGLQNFPEGLAVAAPLRREGLSRFKSFW